MKPTQSLLLLFLLQALAFLLLLGSYVWIQTSVDHSQEINQAALAKWPLLQQRLETESADALRRDARGLAILAAKGNRDIGQMEGLAADMLGFICIPLFVLTAWLGIVAVKLRWPSRRSAVRLPPA
jgi:hypothetical protein